VPTTVALKKKSKYFHAGKKSAKVVRKQIKKESGVVSLI